MLLILASSNDVSYFVVDKVLEQLRGRSPNTSDRSIRNAPGRGMVLPFEPLSMSFNEINYYVDMPAVCMRFLLLFFLNCILMPLPIVVSVTMNFSYHAIVRCIICRLENIF